MRELKRIGNQTEYIELKKKIIDELFNHKWEKLAELVLKEDNEYVTEYLEHDKTNTTFNLELNHLLYSVEDPRLKDRKLRKFFDKVGKIEGIPKVIKYPIKATNAFFKFFIEFSKNPISTYDETTLKIAFCPIITFPLPFESISLNFSEQSLNRTITNSIEFKANETLNYEINIYISSDIKNTIALHNALIILNLPE